MNGPLGGAVICIYLQHFIVPAFHLMSCLPSRQKREAIKALNLLVWKYPVLGNFSGRNVFSKIVALIV